MKFLICAVGIFFNFLFFREPVTTPHPPPKTTPHPPPETTPNPPYTITEYLPTECTFTGSPSAGYDWKTPGYPIPGFGENSLCNIEGRVSELSNIG